MGLIGAKRSFEEAVGIGGALGLNLRGFAADGDPDLFAGLNPFDVLSFEDNLDGLGELDVVDLVVVAAHAHDRQLALRQDLKTFLIRRCVLEVRKLD